MVQIKLQTRICVQRTHFDYGNLLGILDDAQIKAPINTTNATTKTYLYCIYTSHVHNVFVLTIC